MGNKPMFKTNFYVNDKLVWVAEFPDMLIRDRLEEECRLLRDKGYGNVTTITDSSGRLVQIEPFKKASRFSFINDPLHVIFRAAEELWPDIEFEIQYNHELNTDNNEFGCTLFPDDGSIAVIDINPELTVTQQIEIIGHEIAHVKAGKAAEHNEVWEGYFEEIRVKFADILNMEYDTYQSKQDA